MSPGSLLAKLIAAPPLYRADDTIPELGGEAVAPPAAPDMTRAAGAFPAPVTASPTLANTIR